MKKVILGTTFITAALGVMALGQSNKIVLNVGMFTALEDHYKFVADQWKKENPNIEIKVNSAGWADYHQRLTTSMSTGTGLNDVETSELSYIGRFMDSEAVVNLYDAPFNAKDLVKGFTEFTIEQATSTKGRLIGLPVDFGPASTFYRADMFEKAGISIADATKSWESFVEAGKKMKKFNKDWFIIGSTGEFAGIMFQAGAKTGTNPYFGKNDEVLVDGPRFVRAFTLAKELADNKLETGYDPTTSEWLEAAKRGVIATQFGGSWKAGNFKKNLPDQAGLWRIAPMPEKTSLANGGSFYMVTSGSKNKDAAWKFVKFMCANRATLQTVLDKTGAFPGLKSAQVGGVTLKGDPYFGNQKVFEVWAQTARRVPVFVPHKLEAYAADVLYDQLELVVTGKKDIKKALADAKANLERRVKK
jgi:multiple sugar transport system substrate-binding protein